MALMWGKSGADVAAAHANGKVPAKTQPIPAATEHGNPS
jgi:hypothetical protein